MAERYIRTINVNILNTPLPVYIVNDPLQIYMEGEEPEPSGDAIFEFDWRATSNFPYLYVSVTPVTSVDIEWGDGQETTETQNGAQSPQLGVVEGTILHVKIKGQIRTISFSGNNAGLYKLYALEGDHSPLTTVIQGFQGLGSNLLEEIPARLFWNARNITTFSYCFFNRSGLREIPSGLLQFSTLAQRVDYMFSGTGITGIPSTLFHNSPLITNFDGTFLATQLVSIPSELFEMNTEATTFQGTFSTNSLLTTIPEDLFANNTKVTTFQGTFLDCYRIQNIPNLLFDNNKNCINFTNCFRTGTTSSTTGTTPKGSDGLELWERAGQPGYPNAIIGTNCFAGLVRLDNYNDIPVLWGGPVTRASLDVLTDAELSELLSSYEEIQNSEPQARTMSLMIEEDEYNVNSRIDIIKKVIEERSVLNVSELSGIESIDSDMKDKVKQKKTTKNKK